MKTQIIETFKKYHSNKVILDCFDKSLIDLQKYVTKLQAKMNDKLIIISNCRELIDANDHMKKWQFVIFYKNIHFGGDANTIDTCIKQIDSVECIICFKEKEKSNCCTECGKHMCSDCCRRISLGENTMEVKCQNYKTVIPIQFYAASVPCN